MSIVSELRAEKEVLERRLRWINEGLAGVTDTPPERRRRRKGKHRDKGKMSAASRKKLSESLKNAWVNRKKNLTKMEILSPDADI